MKLTKEQRKHLMAAHRAGGLTASRALAKKFGCSENYGAQMCRAAGDKCKQPSRNNRNDPRWGWAIQRGSIAI